MRDEQGRPVTRWDGHSMKIDLATGRDVPDETKRVELYRYVNPRPAKWPEADFIIGNPPFIGGKDVRDRLGDGYAEALWQAYPDMPRSADFVMYWWRRAADLVRTGKARRFGLITTNSLPQTFNRRVVAAQLDAKPPLGLVFAIPDHPWYLERRHGGRTDRHDGRRCRQARGSALPRGRPASEGAQGRRRAPSARARADHLEPDHRGRPRRRKAAAGERRSVLARA